jgi:hypothetical protein
MKLIAAKDFFNAKTIGVTPEVLKADGRFRHENHVHKGCRFSIGKGDVYKDLSADEQYAAGTLISRGMAVIDVSGTEAATPAWKATVEKIDADAKAEYEAHKAALAPKKSLIQALAEAVAVAVAQAMKAPAK